MLVAGINNYTYSPKITPHYKTKQTNPIQVNFTGIDRFEKSAGASFYQGIKSFYTKLEKNMEIIQPSNVEAVVANIVAKTGISREQTLKSLDMLTQYSSYKSLRKIEKELYSKEYYGIKSLPTENKLCQNRDVCLADVLKYISMKNFRYSVDSNSSAIIVDSKMLDFLDKNEIKYNKFFGNRGPVYIENFENGYNFLNQSQSLEEFSIGKIKKALQLQNKNKKDFIYNLKYVLNGNILKRLHKQAIDFQIIKSNIDELPTTEKIAQNVNPIMPNFEKFYTTVQEIVQGGDLSQKDSEAFVLDFLNNMTEIITPRRYSEYLKILHSKIGNLVHQNHKDPTKIYFVVPNIEKSFALTNYMYQKANSASHLKNIYLNQKLGSWTAMEDIEKLPQNSTLVVMDDYLISGLSMLREQFCYDEILKQSSILQKGHKNVIFAPMFATQCGCEEVTRFMDFYKRKGFDKIISGKILPEYEEKYIFNSERKYNRFQTSSVLPYMGPDTNAEELVPLYELFLYSPSAQKTCVNNIGDIYDTLY